MIKEKLSDKRGFARNFLALSSSSFLLHFVNLFTNMYLARALGPEGFGFLGVVMTWGSILQSVAAFGIDQVTTRSVARNQNNTIPLFRISLIVRLIGLLITSFIFGLYIIYTDKINSVFFFLIITYAFAATFWSTVQCVAFGMRRMESNGYINVIGSFILLLLYFILPSILVNVTVIFLIIMIVQIVKDYFYYRQSVKEGIFTTNHSLTLNWSTIFDAIRESFPFYLLVLFGLVTNQFPVLFLSENTNNVEVAYFNTANKLLIPLSVLLTTMFQALFPILVEEKYKQPKKFRLNVKRTLFTIVTIGMMSCWILSLLRNEIVFLIYGEEYISTGMVMLTQCWYVVYFALLSLYGTLYVVLGKDKLLAMLSIINGFVWTPLLWITSKDGAVSISYGFVIGAAINLLTNSIAIHYADSDLISSKWLIELNIIMAIGFIATIIIPIDISLMYRLLFAFLISLLIIPIYNKFRNLSSVITTSFNDEKGVVDYLKSIVSQTLPPNEIVVVDGGSKDSTIKLVTEFAHNSAIPLRLICGEKLNIAEAFNVGIKSAKNQYVLISCIGNEFSSSMCEDLFTKIIESGADATYGLLFGINKGRFSRSYNMAFIGNGQNIMSNRSVMYRKSVFERIGYFKENFRYAGEDAEFLERFDRNNLIRILVDKPTIFWETPNSWKEFLKKCKDYTIAGLQYSSFRNCFMANTMKKYYIVILLFLLFPISFYFPLLGGAILSVSYLRKFYRYKSFQTVILCESWFVLKLYYSLKYFKYIFPKYRVTKYVY